MSYTITLVGCKGDEIELIAMCMDLCGLDMNSASAVVDHMPSILFENIDEDSANKYKKMLEGIGAILKIDEAAAPAANPYDPFPESDFGKMFNNIPSAQVNVSQPVAPSVQPEPVPVQHVVMPEPEPAPVPVPEPQPVPVPEPQPEPVVEPEPARNTQSVIEITPRNVDVSRKAEAPEARQEEVKDNRESSDSGSSEDTKYEYYGYCPKCGSSFVTVKKVGGLFGSNKVKCVCEVCKHKF